MEEVRKEGSEKGRKGGRRKVGGREGMRERRKGGRK